MSDVFFFNDTATTEIYTLSLHDALPICRSEHTPSHHALLTTHRFFFSCSHLAIRAVQILGVIRDPSASSWLIIPGIDRKSTRLNSSHSQISYAVFCLKKKQQERFPRAVH